MGVDTFSAIRREADEALKLHAQHVQQIRLLDMIPAGVVMEAPLDRKHPRHPGREILMHPDDWARLIEEGGFKPIEVQMRISGASEAEIMAERARALAAPEGWKLFGIPVVDDSDKTRAARMLRHD